MLKISVGYKWHECCMCMHRMQFTFAYLEAMPMTLILPEEIVAGNVTILINIGVKMLIFM